MRFFLHCGTRGSARVSPGPHSRNMREREPHGTPRHGEPRAGQAAGHEPWGALSLPVSKRGRPGRSLDVSFASVCPETHSSGFTTDTRGARRCDVEQGRKMYSGAGVPIWALRCIRVNKAVFVIIIMDSLARASLFRSATARSTTAYS